MSHPEADADAIWIDLMQQDRLQNLPGVVQHCVRLLALGHTASFSTLEQQLRRNDANTYLIAYPWLPESMPKNLECMNPLQIDKAFEPQFYVSFSMEKDSLDNELINARCDSLQENIRRLRNEYCGILVFDKKIENTAASGSLFTNTNGWAEMMASYTGNAQACTDQTSNLLALPECAHCKRLPTKATIMRAIPCCSGFICSPQCWNAHESHAIEKE